MKVFVQSIHIICKYVVYFCDSITKRVALKRRCCAAYFVGESNHRFGITQAPIGVHCPVQLVWAVWLSADKDFPKRTHPIRHIVAVKHLFQHHLNERSFYIPNSTWQSNEHYTINKITAFEQTTQKISNGIRLSVDY